MLGALTIEDMNRMSASDRLELIGRLWDSLENDPCPLSQAQQDELGRRLSQLSSERAEGSDWETLRATLR